MFRALPEPHDMCDRACGGTALRLALGLFLGLQLGLFAGCGRPEPGAPTDVASPPSKPAATASASASVAVSTVSAPVDLAAPAALRAAATAASAPAPSPSTAKTVSPTVESPVARASAALPPAIIAFQKQREACDHFRGEVPHDKQRAVFLKTELAKTCKGTDRALAGLRKRFAHDPDALAALKDYEDRIE